MKNKMKTKYIVIAFLVSLLLNAFLGGMMLSNHIHRDQMPFFKERMRKDGGPQRKEDMIFQRVTEQSEKLSAEGQKKVGEIVGKYHKKDDIKGPEDKHKLFDEIQATMTAPKFDKAKMEKIHQTLNADENKDREAVGRMMIEIASTLSDEDRIQFFQGLFPQHPQMEGKRDRHGPDDHGPDEPDDLGPPDHD